jgi:acyl carrier protein
VPPVARERERGRAREEKWGDMSMTTEAEVLKWVGELFEHPEPLAPETLRETIPMWDSLGTLNLLAGLDEKFGIILPDAELRAMTKVDDILVVLRREGKLS